MLREVLQAIEAADGPVHVGALSRQLHIEHSALEGMIDYWVRKGRLQALHVKEQLCAPAATHCGGGCTGTAACTFIARMPKSYTLQMTETSHRA